jgi:hypothetical protein
MSSESETLGPNRQPETQFRRSDFLGGLAVRLADGRGWFFAGPGEISASGEPLRAEVEALLTEIAEAEDEADRLRGELALAIRLLSLNYDLTPDDYSRLLACPAGQPGLSELQIAFRDLALRHAQGLRPREEVPTATHGRLFRLLTFRPPHRAREGVGSSNR